jgi:hypothetical protein
MIVLCLTDRNGAAHALAGVLDGRLTVMAASELADDLRNLVEHLAENGAAARQETQAPGLLEIEFERVEAGHPLFMEAVAEAMRARRHEAHLSTPERGRAWFLLKTLPVEDAALRKMLLTALPNIEDGEVSSLLKELETTAAELAAIDRRLEETVARLK